MTKTHAYSHLLLLVSLIAAPACSNEAEPEPVYRLGGEPLFVLSAVPATWNRETRRLVPECRAGGVPSGVL